jgi:hypothetical protein
MDISWIQHILRVLKILPLDSTISDYIIIPLPTVGFKGSPLSCFIHAIMYLETEKNKNDFLSLKSESPFPAQHGCNAYDTRWT